MSPENLSLADRGSVAAAIASWPILECTGPQTQLSFLAKERFSNSLIRLMQKSILAEAEN